jgi:hypothetical protein
VIAVSGAPAVAVPGGPAADDEVVLVITRPSDTRMPRTVDDAGAELARLRTLVDTVGTDQQARLVDRQRELLRLKTQLATEERP